jgi:hypothetical protein
MKKARKAVEREASRMPEHLEKRLAGYVLAAGAAGVGVLALAQPAQADIIVSTTPIAITPAHTDYMTYASVDINGMNVLRLRNRGTPAFVEPLPECQSFGGAPRQRRSNRSGRSIQNRRHTGQ